VTAPFPNGDVFGTDSGAFIVYVVPAGTPKLAVAGHARISELLPPAEITVTGRGPAGIALDTAHATAMMPGFMLQDSALAPVGDSLSYHYDPVTLGQDFSMLDTEILGQPSAAGLITINMFAQGEDAQGQRVYAAKVVNLHGTQLLNMDDVDTDGDGVIDAHDAFPEVPGEPLDTDGDGVGNNSDSDDDGEGTSDEYESAHGLLPLDAADGVLDLDGDGLSNIAEFQLGTAANNIDTDGDGVDDKTEVDSGTDPLLDTRPALNAIIQMLLIDD